jgi:uncharacterized protein (UPF0332 family)
VKPQTGAFLDKARELLSRADAMLGIGLNEDAGRTAYLAGLHAAQAFIFESTGRAFKKHSGVQREFARLAKSEPSIDSELRAFLPRTYNFKAIADYETGPGSKMSAESARAAVQAARRFVEHVIALIPPNSLVPRVLDEPKP